MLISEIFFSIQGEGALTGVPSIFIRTSGCNLRCAWCDTPYASWSPEGTEMTVESIIDEICQFPASHCVLTGGEPMVAKEIHSLADSLHKHGYHITIETAGTVPPDGIACDLASLSPKLSNSTPQHGSIAPGWIAKHEATRLNPEIIRAWIANYETQLKFVISHPEDAEEIETLIQPMNIPPWRVQLMPEGTNSESLRARSEMLVALCKSRGYRYCDRLHIHLFGNSKGT